MSQRLLRQFTIRARAADDGDDESDDLSFPAVLSSDAPVDRGGYVEILDHSPDSVDLTRAPLPLLESHDVTKSPVGVVDGLKLQAGKLRGMVRFSKSTRGRELAADVNDGILRSLSVGYEIHAHTIDHDTDTVRATRWTPMEASAVAVPADVSAGFFRGLFMSNESTDTPSRRERRAEAESSAQERDRALAIYRIASQHGMGQRASGWIAEGLTTEQVREAILEARGTDPRTMIRGSSSDGLEHFGPASSRGAGDSADSPIPLEELRKYSLLRAIRSQLDGDRRAIREAGFELEVSRTLCDHCDRAAKGLMVPDELFMGTRSMRAAAARWQRAMTAGTANAGGDLVATDLLAGEFIETLANQPQVFELGARRLTGLVGNVAIPRMTAGDAVHWIGEGGDYGDTQPTFDQPQMSPHDLSARVDISRRLLIQSTPDAEGIVRSDLALRLGIGIDLAVIAGTGSSNQPTGLLSTSGIGSVALGTNGAAPTWNAVTEVIQTVASANGLRGNIGWLVNGNTQGTLMRTPLVSGFPRFVWEAAQPGARPDEGTIAGYRALVSNNVPNNLTKGSGTNLSALLFGNWLDVLVGQWRGIDMLVDPYSNSSTGTVRLTAIQTLDILVRHAASFCAILDAVTT